MLNLNLSTQLQPEKTLDKQEDNVKSLNISECSLDRLPGRIPSLTMLTSLTLSKNNISELPISVSSLCRLQTLFMTKNRFSCLPACVQSLTALKRLALSNNRLTSLPRWFGDLDRLQYLDLQENEIVELPKSISRCTRLSKVYLARNKLVELPSQLALCFEGTFEVLDVRFNRILTLPSSIWALGSKIQTEGNPIVCQLLDHVMALPIHEIDVILNKDLSALQSISIKDLNVSKIPADLVHATSVKLWDIRGNPELRRLPLWMAELAGLKTIKFTPNNTKLAIPPNVLNQKTAGILRYLHDVANPKQSFEWKSGKIMVLGQEAAGKTSLYHAIAEKRYKKNISTDGIDIHQITLAGISCEWFDFGGQEVFHVSHSLFLTTKCLYVVAFSLVETSYSERAQFWLDEIAALVDRTGEEPPPIFLVATHSDRGDAAAANEWIDSIRDSVPGLAGSYFVNCLDKDTLVQLKHEIGIRLKEVSENHRVPLFYRQVHECCAHFCKRSPYMTFSRFHHNYLADLSKKQLDRALLFLHQRGHILYVSNKSQIVLDVPWIASRFCDIISFKHSWKDGVVPMASLQGIWKKSTAEERQLFVSVFVDFELAFKSDDEQSLVVMSLLPIRPPPPISDKKHGNIRWVRIFPVSAGLTVHFGQLMVRFRKWEKTELSRDWFDTLLPDQGEFARVSIRGRAFYVECRSRNTTCEIMERLTDEIGNILGYQAWKLVCPHCLERQVECPSLFTREQCVALVSGGKKTYTCGQDRVSTALLGKDVALTMVPQIPTENLAMGKKLGAGGFGDVFLGHWQSQPVAIKSLHTSDGDGFFEFQREMKIMSQLRHENLVQVFGVAFNPLRMILEFCGKGDLHECLSAEPFSPPLQAKVALDVAIGMAFLHGQRPPIAHRDLRSPNVLMVSLSPEDPVCAKIADFGLSVAVSARLKDPLATWQWMPPEVLAGERYTERCDLYSYGVVLWEIMTAKLPFIDAYEFIKHYENVSTYFCATCAADWFNKYAAEESKVASNEVIAVKPPLLKEQSPNPPSCVQNEECVLREAILPYVDIFDKQSIVRAIIEGLRIEIPADVAPWQSELLSFLWKHSPEERRSFTRVVDVICRFTGRHVDPLSLPALGSAEGDTGAEPAPGKEALVYTIPTQGDLTGNHLAILGAVAFVGLHSGVVQRYDAAQRRFISQSKVSSAPISCVVCSRVQRCALVASEDGRVLRVEEDSAQAQPQTQKNKASSRRLKIAKASKQRGSPGVPSSLLEPLSSTNAITQLAAVGDWLVTGDSGGTLRWFNSSRNFSVGKSISDEGIRVIAAVGPCSVWAATANSLFQVSILGHAKMAHSEFARTPNVSCIASWKGQTFTCCGGDVSIWENQKRISVIACALLSDITAALVGSLEAKPCLILGGTNELRVWHLDPMRPSRTISFHGVVKQICRAAGENSFWVATNESLLEVDFNLP